MAEFITGIKEKYPAQLLKGRVEVEGNVVSCFFKDMLLLDECTLDSKDFMTSDGEFYFSMLKNLRKKGFYSLDEVTILSNSTEEVIDKFEERGGWETIQHQLEIINEKNFDTYIDILYRENILCKMHADGFNLLTPIELNNKKVAPYKLLRKMSAEEAIDWWEARLSTYGTGYSSKILEEDYITFDDDFIDSCEEGEENGVPFDIAGTDINGDDMNCLPFLSKQSMGFLPGTTSMIAGFSSTGKSTLFITLIMGLLYRGRKVLIISNEENIKKYKIKFMIWLMAKHNRYYKLTKKKMSTGQISPEDRAELKDVQKYWEEHYKDKVKFIAIVDADMSVVKKKIRENVLRYGFDVCVYDTFKMQEDDFEGTRQDLSLIRDSRSLDKIAKKYNIIMLAAIQMAEHMRSRLWVGADCLSNSKQVKEILENLFMMRNMFPEERDPKSKFYCHPFRIKKVNDKWVEEPFELDPMYTYKILFPEKVRNGANSNDTGTAYVLAFDGDHCVFRETAQCYPKHGEIR